MRFFIRKFREIRWKKHLRFLLSLLIAVGAVAFMFRTAFVQVNSSAQDVVRTSHQIQTQKNEDGSIKLDVIQPIIRWQFEMFNEYRSLRTTSYLLATFFSAILLLYVINRRED